METNNELIKTVMRKRGELNLTNKKLSELTGVSQWTLTALFNGKRKTIYKSTNDKLSDWLFKQL